MKIRGPFGSQSRSRAMVSRHGRFATTRRQFLQAGSRSFVEKSLCCRKPISINYLNGLQNGCLRHLSLKISGSSVILYPIAAPESGVRCPARGVKRQGSLTAPFGFSGSQIEGRAARHQAERQVIRDAYYLASVPSLSRQRPSSRRGRLVIHIEREPPKS
jgi:hypothetical protein